MTETLPNQETATDNDWNNDLSPYRSLVTQVREEYEMAYRAQVSRIQLLLKRLKLYNNQRRDPQTVGDPLLFTIFQSVLASLYDDQLSVEFIGRSEGKEDKADALSNMAKFDFDEMLKSQIDYEWIWDTMFFGRGIIGMNYFDRKKMHPVPEVWDPTTMLHDTDATSVNGDAQGRGAARFLGREILLRKTDIEEIPSVFDVDMLKYSRPTRSLVDQARQYREDAQGLNNQVKYEEKKLGENARLPLLEWFTWWNHPEKTNGETKRVLVWLGNDMTKVCRFKVLDEEYWPLIDRSLFPSAHAWDGTSLPDLIEDKQRMRSTLLNMNMKREKAQLFGMYLYDKNKIKNKEDLSFDFDKAVPVDLTSGGNLEGAVIPMPRDTVNQSAFLQVMNMLDQSAQSATSTPESQQGMPTKGKKTLGEIQKMDSKISNRLSLASKIFGWSEKDFWYQWYALYKKHFHPRIDQKIIRINGAFGPKYQNIVRESVIDEKTDPDLEIKSKFLSEQQRNQRRQMMTSFAAIAMKVQGVNSRYMVKRLGALHAIPKDELDRIFPLTPDERKAINENEALNENDDMPVAPEDNHQEHLEQHARARETQATLAHIATHQHAMELQKQKPELFPQMQQQQQQQQQSQQQAGQQMGKNRCSDGW